MARVRPEFLAKVDHELRTPLTGILGITEMLDYGIYGTLSNQQKEALKQLRANAQQIVRSVNDLIQQANLEQGGLNLYTAPVSVSGLWKYLTLV